MSRNSSGTYSLPTGQPVVAGTTISSVTHNTLASDIATALTDSLSRSGSGGMQAPLRTPDGSVSAPTHSFTNQTNTGLYRAGPSDVRLSVNGTDAVEVTATEIDVNDRPIVGCPNAARAWAALSIGAAGAVTVDAGHNIASATWANQYLTVVFTDAIQTPYIALGVALLAPVADVRELRTMQSYTKTTAQMVLVYPPNPLIEGVVGANWASGMIAEVVVFGP